MMSYSILVNAQHRLEAGQITRTIKLLLNFKCESLSQGLVLTSMFSGELDASQQFCVPNLNLRRLNK